jgi:phosphatidylglycerol:prolipoprotein diacylglycerol transferase
MRPNLFHIGSGANAFPVHSYGFFIAVGLIVAVALSVRRGHSVGIETGVSLDLTFYAIVVGLVGARLLYVLMHAGMYASVCRGTGVHRSLGQWASDCTAAVRFWQGGLVFLGGAVLAAASTLLIARRRGLGLGTVADVLAPSVSLAHVFGRLGCFMVGCCYGKPWSGGVHFPPDSVAYSEWASQRGFRLGAASTPGLHPTQLYEAGGELLIFCLLLLLSRRRKFPGAVALAYAFAYGTLRFVVEIFRGDDLRAFLFKVRLPGFATLLGLPPDEPLFLSSAQATSLALIASAAITYAVLRRRSLGFSQPVIP